MIKLAHSVCALGAIALLASLAAAYPQDAATLQESVFDTTQHTICRCLYVSNGLPRCFHSLIEQFFFALKDTASAP